jgi:(1->4)-alpha-D-glucan 1-alpha-D-glucosylmutase
VPDRNEEYLLYQTLVGAWPFDEDLAAFQDRVRTYMMKALREAKVHTSWFHTDEEYEAGVLRFVDGILDTRRANPFLQAFQPFQTRVAELGIYNSLAQLLIKIAAPGVPDFYQGTELWDLNLVDPDNRRPVDYAKRREALAALRRSPSPDALLEARRDGRVKLFVMMRALETRARFRHVFQAGEYLPLPTSGTRRDCVFAFARRDGDTTVVACVPRLVASLVPDAAAPPIGAVWGDTTIELPPSGEAGSNRTYRDVFTGATVDAVDGAARAAQVFERFPVALLTT